MAVLFYAEIDFVWNTTTPVTIATIPPAATLLGPGGTYGPNPILFVVWSSIAASGATRAQPILHMGGQVWVDFSNFNSYSHYLYAEAGGGSPTPRLGTQNWMLPMRPASPVNQSGFTANAINLDLGTTLEFVVTGTIASFLTGTHTTDWLKTAMSGTLSSGTPVSNPPNPAYVPVTGVGTQFMSELTTTYDFTDTGTAGYTAGTYTVANGQWTAPSTALIKLQATRTSIAPIWGPDTLTLYTNTTNNFATATAAVTFTINVQNATMSFDWDTASGGPYWWLVFFDRSDSPTPATYEFTFRTYAIAPDWVVPTSGTPFTVQSIIDDTNLHANASTSLGISSSAAESWTGDTLVTGSGSLYTTELQVGANVWVNGILDTVGSIIDDTHFRTAVDTWSGTWQGPASGSPSTDAPAAVTVETDYAYPSSDERNTMMVFVLDPEEASAVVKGFSSNPGLYIPGTYHNTSFAANDFTIDAHFTGPYPTTGPQAQPPIDFESWYDNVSGVQFSADFLARFGVLTFAELATASPPYTLPDLVGTNPNFSMIGARQNGNCVIAAALWTRQTLGPPLDFTLDTTEPPGTGMMLFYEVIGPFHNPPTGRSYGTIIGD